MHIICTCILIMEEDVTLSQILRLLYPLCTAYSAALTKSQIMRPGIHNVRYAVLHLLRVK